MARHRPSPHHKLKIMFLKKEKLMYLFVEPDGENYLSFKEILIGKDSTKKWVVPGSTSDKEVVRPTDLSRVCMLKLIQLGWTLNSHGWSFGADLSPEDLFMTYTGELRVSLEKWSTLKDISGTDVGLQWTNVKLQWNSIASIIRGVIFCGMAEDDLPIDAVKLLNLLENLDPIFFEALPDHPALKDEVDTLAQFGEIYMELLQVKQTDGGRYNKVVSKLKPFCQTDENHWKLQALENKHLEGVLKYASKKPYEREKYMKLQNESDNHSVYASHLPKLKPSDLNRFALVLLHEWRLDTFVDPDRLEMILDLIKSEEFYFGPYERHDRDAFFRFILSDLMLTYSDNGGDLITDIRNSGQHLIEAHSIEVTFTKPLTTKSAATAESSPVPAESAPMPVQMLASLPASQSASMLATELSSMPQPLSIESASVLATELASMPATELALMLATESESSFMPQPLSNESASVLATELASMPATELASMLATEYESASMPQSLSNESTSVLPTESAFMPAIESASMLATESESAPTPQPLSSDSTSVQRPATFAKSKQYKILFKYFQVVHIIVSCHPAVFSDFYMAAFTEGLVKKSTEKSVVYFPSP